MVVSLKDRRFIWVNQIDSMNSGCDRTTINTNQSVVDQSRRLHRIEGSERRRSISEPPTDETIRNCMDVLALRVTSDSARLGQPCLPVCGPMQSVTLVATLRPPLLRFVSRYTTFAVRVCAFWLARGSSASAKNSGASIAARTVYLSRRFWLRARIPGCALVIATAATRAQNAFINSTTAYYGLRNV